MSILIKSIKMPKNCDICFIRDVCEYSMPLSKRPIDCPLVEVPEPHGDLIDRDTLKLKHRWTDDFYETEYVEVNDIDDAPTIIPAEEE